MQAKSTRGVQQEEVWVAADALIAAGERPTIERVRLKIGRGSPNTVSPMLEAWFATLATRLGVAAESAHSEEGAPKELRQALDKVWATAVSAARYEADRALEPERERLARCDLDLQTACQNLAQRESALAERGVALEHALELVKFQLRDQAALIEKTGRELERARGSLAAMVKERDEDRRQFDEQIRALTGERKRIEQRAFANERRLLEEVDRARQESKQSSRALEDVRQKHAIEKESLECISAELSSRAHEGQVELATLRERLQSAEERIKGLETTIAAAATESRQVVKGRPVKNRPAGRSTIGAVKAKRPS